MMQNRFFTNKQCKEDSVEVPFFDNESCCDPDVPTPPDDCTALDPFLLCNPSFESPHYGFGQAYPWFNNNIQCWRVYDEGEADILPSAPIADAPQNGISYVGLMPFAIIEQTLAFPMTPTILIYSFNVSTIELTSRIWAPGIGYGVLEVWGGIVNNNPTELLWTSPVINQGTNWIPFAVSFIPTQANRYLFFKYNMTQGTSCYMGIDNMSEIQTQCVQL